MNNFRFAEIVYKHCERFLILKFYNFQERQELISKKMIQTVAVVAGAGGSLLKGVQADLYLTGEMSHHDVLAATANGTSVLLCDHTNTERGYLFNKLKCDLTSLLNSAVEIITSNFDGDPLTVI